MKEEYNHRYEFETGTEAHEKARHIARYSRRDMICWHSRDGKRHCVQGYSLESLRAALLASGTQQKIYEYHAGGACLGIRWRQAIENLLQIKQYRASI